MLASANAKLVITYSAGSVVLSAALIHDYSTDEEFDSDQITLAIDADFLPVNHLICMGSGELKDRIRLDLYASSTGVVSQTQTLFNVDENAEYYDYSSADSDTLLTNGTTKLQGYQDGANTITIDISPTETEFDIGDIVGGRENTTGIFVTSAVTKKVVTIQHDYVSIEYSCGTATTSATEQAIADLNAQSLAAINKAISAAESVASKATVYTTTPTTPYTVGDLWDGSTT
jgi:hypothetical protein